MESAQLFDIVQRSRKLRYRILRIYLLPQIRDRVGDLLRRSSGSEESPNCSPKANEGNDHAADAGIVGPGMNTSYEPIHGRCIQVTS